MERVTPRALPAGIYLLALCSLVWIAGASLSLAGQNRSGLKTGRAQESGPAATTGKFRDACSDRLYRRGAERKMPPAIQAHLSELEQQLHPADLLTGAEKSELGCLPVAEAWPHPYPAMGNSRVSNLYLVVFETIIRENYPRGGWRDTPQSLAMAVVALPAAGAPVASDAAGLSVVAKTPQPLERMGELDRFDFAPYRLNEQEMAFGLRSTFNTTYIGGGGKDEVLELFRVKDGGIESVLRTLMRSSNFVKGEQRGDPKGAVIRVLSTKSNGMFDLKKSARGGRSGVPDAPGVGAVGWRSAIYRWNGQRYETHDPEPVECFNEPCQDIARELANSN